MKLEGKIINFLGDSITEGCGTSDVQFAFHQRIKEKYNLKEACNCGIGGTCIAKQTNPTLDNPKYDLYFQLRAQTMCKDCDAVVVFGGTNDYGHGDAHIGTPESDDICTFYGALNSLITFLQTEYKKAEIIFMTPLHRLNDTEPKAPDNKTLADYVEIIKEVCNKRGVKVIDLFAINPLDPTDENLLPDGLHPNDDGHAIMAEVIAEELLKL